MQGKNAAKFEQYQLAEIKHSRLAMLAFSGSVASSTPSASSLAMFALPLAPCYAFLRRVGCLRLGSTVSPALDWNLFASFSNSLKGAFPLSFLLGAHTENLIAVLSARILVLMDSLLLISF